MTITYQSFFLHTESLNEYDILVTLIFYSKLFHLGSKYNFKIFIFNTSFHKVLNERRCKKGPWNGQGRHFGGSLILDPQQPEGAPVDGKTFFPEVTFDACSLEVSRALKKVVHKLKH
jgi:hypothetical protein